MSAMNTTTYLLRGGLDLITPAIAVKPGYAISCRNYESEVRGYRRVPGHERYDGRGSPSAASYWVLNFDAGSAAIAVDDVVTGATSSATGKVLIDPVIESGTIGGGDAAGYLVLTDVSGTFQDDENLQVSASTKAAANGTATARGADNDTDDNTWLRAAIAERRSLIGAVTGSGPIRGVWIYKGDRYAIRDNAGATAAVLFKATTSGWTAQDLGSIIRFDAGTAAFTEGETLTGGTSSATATIRRVVHKSGTYAGTDASGFLVISGISGTFQDNETITDGASGSATSASATIANSLPAGGQYDFVNHNFYGASNLVRMYGVNGVGKGFEWDGTYFCPLETGVEDSLDKPQRVDVYKNHLFLSYAGGSLQFSELGTPTQFKVIGGAGEIGFGEDITGIKNAVATALFIIGTNKIGYLTGSSSSDFVLSDLSDEAGGKAWTAQNMGGLMYLDDRGLRRVSATQAFGDFRLGTLTQMVEPFFRSQKDRGALPVGSMRVRARDIYRLFYDDGKCLSVYFGREKPECMILEYPFTVASTCSGEDTSGNEVLLVGAEEDGWVYELDKGTSFDGAEIDAFVRLAFNNVGSATQKKRWHKVTLEVDTDGVIDLSLVAEFAYGSPLQPPGTEQAFSVAGGGGFWNEDTWNNFLWSAEVVGQAEAYVDGIGRNLSPTVISTATHEQPHTLNSITIHFAYRGMVK